MTLRAMGLVKRFGAAPVVSGVDLSVDPGEVVGLLGPNGAGKTTTLRMLAGILPPTEGQVLIAGVDVHRDPLLAKPRVGFLSGDTQLYQRLSPREVLAYFGKLYSMPADRVAHRVEQLVADLAMGDFADRPCATLSAGQKQRANIARAFLHEPDLLILDEPTTALDVFSGRFIVDSIRAQRSLGRAVLFSTHILSEAEYLCDRIALLHQGQIVAQGTTAELIALAGKANLTDAFLSLLGSPTPAGRGPGQGGEGGAAKVAAPGIDKPLSKRILPRIGPSIPRYATRTSMARHARWVVGAAALVLAGCGLGGPKATSEKPALSSAAPVSSGEVKVDVDRPEVKASGPKIAALALTTPIYEGPHRKAKSIGYMRLGEALPRSERPVAGDGRCAEGWYAVLPTGYVCADGQEATLDLGHKIIRALGVKPDLSRPMPYNYGFVRANGALYHQVPVVKDQDRFEFGLRDHLKGFKKSHTKWNKVDKAGANHVPLDENGIARMAPKEVPPPPPQADEDNLFGNLEDGDTPWWLRGRRQIPNISTYKAPEYAVFNGKVYRHAGLAVVGSFRADEKAGNRKFAVLLDGRIVGEDKLKPHYASPFHGMPLDGSIPFPFALVRKDTATYFEPGDNSKWRKGDEATYREVIPLTGNTKMYPSTKYYETKDGKWLRMDHIAVFNTPPEMPKRFDYRSTKWIDVSIWQQTLVLYEGEKPIYATLVSTGADGMGDPETTKSTIRGEFRIDYKHVTATMDADDPENRFELRDVPWVQYFERGYALHTAYWHDDFGTPRSHGCINLAPVDARRVFFWTDPPLPKNWHGVKSSEASPGTWVRVRG